MKILVIGPSWVGDMVMSQSLYITLKKQHPEAQIDVLAPTWCLPILERIPEVTRALEMPIGRGVMNINGRWQLGRVLAKEGYTHTYVLPNSAKSALIPFFARIPHRIGWKGEFRYGLLTDLRPNKRDFQYMVERYVALAFEQEKMLESVALPHCPLPCLNTDLQTQQEVMQRLALNDKRPIIGLCPGAEFGPSKRWPEAYYAELATTLIQQGQQIWLFGSNKDRTVTEKIVNALPNELQQYCFNLAGNTQLVEAVDLLAACYIVICNDSGLMHVSAAVGCHVVAIYGSSSPQYTPPLTDKLTVLHTDIACRPCFKRECSLKHLNCLKQLLPTKVIEVLQPLLKVE